MMRFFSRIIFHALDHLSYFIKDTVVREILLTVLEFSLAFEFDPSTKTQDFSEVFTLCLTYTATKSLNASLLCLLTQPSVHRCYGSSSNYLLYPRLPYQSLHLPNY